MKKQPIPTEPRVDISNDYYCPRCMSSKFKGNSSKNCPDCKKLRSGKK